MTQLDNYKRRFAAEKSGTLTGYSLVFIPRSWAVGVWRRPKKTIYALGPFRWAVHYGLGEWKE